MKTVIMALTMLVGASAFAADYGPGAYTKDVTVCYGENGKGEPGSQCRNVKYKYFAPRYERICRRLGKNGSSAMPPKCYNRLTTGNYTARGPVSREERRLEEKNNGGSGREYKQDNRN